MIDWISITYFMIAGILFLASLPMVPVKNVVNLSWVFVLTILWPMTLILVVGSAIYNIFFGDIN